jgi:hypothetical protein
MEENKSEVVELNSNLDKLSSRLAKIYSYKQVFLRGIVNGVGTIIGATVVAALLLTLVLRFADIFGLRPFLERIIPEETVPETIGGLRR